MNVCMKQSKIFSFSAIFFAVLCFCLTSCASNKKNDVISKAYYENEINEEFNASDQKDKLSDNEKDNKNLKNAADTSDNDSENQQSETVFAENVTTETAADEIISEEMQNSKKISKKDQKAERKAKKARKSEKKEVVKAEQPKKQEKSKKEIEAEENNFSGWINPKVRSIEENFGSLKLRAKTKIGTFNIAVIDDASKKVIPVLSTSNEYTTTGFFLRIGNKIIQLNNDASVNTSAWKTDTGIGLGYRISGVADVVIILDCFQSNPDFDDDSIKMTVTVSNMGKKKDSFAVKAILDTILGETDRHHFYSSSDKPVKNEISLRYFDEDKWFVSKNTSAGLQIIFDGGDATTPELVALANYTTLDTRNWEPDLLSYRAFDTVLSYSNSAVGITWPEHKLASHEQFTETFYLSTAYGDRMPSGAAFVLNLEPSVVEEVYYEESVETIEQSNDTDEIDVGDIEEIKNDDEEKTSENLVSAENEKTNLPPYVKFDVNTISRNQLTPEYIQKLLEKIELLEESDDSMNKEELLALNAELDAILETLRM